MGINLSLPINQGYSSGGGNSSAANVSKSDSNSWGYSDAYSNAYSNSWSRTYGSEATAKSYAEAEAAHKRQLELMYLQNEYNAEEAEKQRAFNYLTGSEIYTRSVKNMIEAGINPILAAGFGLSGATVNSGAAASNSTPSTFMGQTFADSASQSHSESHSESHSRSGSSSHSEGHGESSGANWSNSENGIVTAIQSMGQMFGNLLDKANTSVTVNNILDKAESATDKARKKGNEALEPINKAIDKLLNRNNYTGANNGGGKSW